jgi:hypothetical protein
MDLVQETSVSRFWWENHKERDHYEEVDVGGRIILKRLLEK